MVWRGELVAGGGEAPTAEGCGREAGDCASGEHLAGVSGGLCELESLGVLCLVVCGVWEVQLV